MKWVIRIVVGIVTVLVLCVVVLLLLGLREDADRLQSSVTIKSSPENIWPWLYETEKLKTWVSWLKAVEGDRPGPPVVGARGTWVMEDMNNGGALMRIDSQVEAVEPNRRLAVKLLVANVFRGSAQYTLTDLGGGATRLGVDSRYNFDMWFAKLMSPLIFPEARKKMASDFERLRLAVEGPAANPVSH